MRKLGCFSAVAAALLMSAGTAHADPFTVTADMQAPRNAIQSTRGVDDLWFNSIIKVNSSTPERLFLADSIIIFGGDAVSVPNDAISFTVTPASSSAGDSNNGVRGWVSHGSNGFFLSGGVDTLSAVVGSHTTVSTSTPTMSGSSANSSSGLSLNVPGASGALDPLSSNFGAIGVQVINGNQQFNGAIVGTSQFLTALEDNLMGGSNSAASANDPRSDPPVTANIGTTAGPSIPATPEPSPLLLLAAGLGFVVVQKRNALGVGA